MILDAITYLFTGGGLQEALQGFDFKPAIEVLKAAEVLIPGPDRNQKMHRVPDGNKRFYFIDPAKL